jgi:hypothetical protein
MRKSIPVVCLTHSDEGSRKEHGIAWHLEDGMNAFPDAGEGQASITGYSPNSS